MTTAINVTYPTLVDQIKRMDPDGGIAQIVELLSGQRPLLQDMAWKEGNLPTGHRVTTRTALPSVGWRRYNEGVAASKSRTDQQDETCGMLEANSVVDEDLAKLNGNEAAFRASEDTAFMEAMAKEVEDSLFYASTTSAPEEILGLTPRFNSTTTSKAASQVIESQIAHSSSDQTSVWFIVWGPKTVYGIYPKGSTGGITVNDMGIQLWTDGSSNKYRAYVTNFKWKLGLCVEDWRYVVRLCNIDTSAISKTGTLLIEDMINAYYKLKDTNAGRLAIYCNRTVHTYLHLQALDQAQNGTLTIENVAGGGPITTFMGAPLRISDSLTNIEAVVS